jgi:hypothetical protein
VAAHEKRSKKGCARLQAEQGAKEDLTALKAMWACSHPEVRDYAARCTTWGQEGMAEAMQWGFAVKY